MRGLRGLDAWLLLAFLCTVFGIHIPPEVEQLPTITSQSPRSLVALPFDDNITLSCEAKGNPKPTFRWTKNGLDFDPHKDSVLKTYENSGSFVIPNKIIAKYQSKYRCYVSNKLGTAMSEETDLTVPPSPKFPKERIEPVVLNVGKSLVLECNPPKGIPPRQLYWMTMGLQHIHQNERVSMGLNGNLYFSNVLESDSHSDYCCYASFPKIRTIVQKPAMAVVVNPLSLSEETNIQSLYRKPRFLVPSGDEAQIYLVKGEELELECIAEGLPTPMIEWSKSGEKLPKRTNIRNYGKLLTITKVTEEDSGKYACRAVNSAGEAVHHFPIKVEEPPRWVEQPQKSQVVAIGSDVHIKCHAAGTPWPAVTWMRNGKPLSEFPLPSVTIQPDTIILEKAQPNDSAVYQCEASNRHGSILSNANVMVMNHPPLILTRTSLEYSAVHGKSVIIDCEVFSSPPSSVHWRKEELEGSVKGERFTLHKNGSLQIHSSKVEDTGKYTCLAENSESASSISAVLHIKRPTKIVAPPQDTEIRRGSRAELLCQAECDQSFSDELEILWQKNGEEIHSNHTKDSGYYIAEGIFQIINVSHSDKGLYTCIAKTTLDQDTASAHVTVLDVPDPPINISLSDLRDRSVKLKWEPTKDYNSPITEYIIEFEENHWEPGKWKPLLRVSGYQNHAPVPLYGNINYQFRVSAVNAIGRGHPSQPSERYKTPPSAPDRNPENIKIEGHVPDQMDITWEPLLPIEHNGPDLEYKLSYRQMGAEESWTEHIIKRHSFAVKDTPTYVLYEVKIQAFNRVGWAVEPGVVTGYSGEDLPLEAPEDVQAEILNYTMLWLSWSPVHQDQLRGHLEGYTVIWWRTESLMTSSEVPDQKQSHTVLGNQSHTMVPIIKPFSKYKLTINVFNRKGSGPSSNPVTFTTPEGVPESPPILRATNPQDNSITLVWAPPHETNGILTGYWLKYQRVNGTLDVGEPYTVNISGPDITQWLLHDLETSGQYKFNLSACTQVGCGPAISEEGNTATVARVAGVHGSISSTSWLVGIMCIVAFCTLAVMIACFVKNNKSGKYAVNAKEEIRVDLESQGENEETSSEYSDSDEKPLKSWLQSPDGHEITHMKEDSSSMEGSSRYGEEDCEFKEDGSFIGEYVGFRQRVSMEMNEVAD